MSYYSTDPDGWEKRRAADLEGRQCRPRTCMGCGEETEVWWRRLGPTATAKFSSGRRRVVLCESCVEDLAGRLTPKLISGGSVTQAEAIEDLRLEIGEAKDLLGEGGDGTLKGRVESLLSELHLYRDVVEKARWWRDHPGAPGKKLIAALYELDAAEGRDVVRQVREKLEAQADARLLDVVMRLREEADKADGNWGVVEDVCVKLLERLKPDEDRSESATLDEIEQRLAESPEDRAALDRFLGRCAHCNGERWLNVGVIVDEFAPCPKCNPEGKVARGSTASDVFDEVVHAEIARDSEKSILSHLGDPRDLAEEKARELASNAYHEHPSNPSTCEVYRKHYDRPCVCEDDWHHYLPKGEPTAVDLMNEGYVARVEYGEVEGKHAVHFEHPDRVTITRRYTAQQCKVLEYVQDGLRGKHPPVEIEPEHATVKCTFCDREAVTSDLDGNEVCKEHAVC